MRKTRKLPTLAARLEDRYPGVWCSVEWNEFEPHPPDRKGHALYALRFFADERATLIEHGLACAAQFEARAVTGRVQHTHDSLGNPVSVYEHGGHGRPKCYEVTMLVMDYDNNDERPFTKRLQTQVARTLRPLVRGTWKPAQDLTVQIAALKSPDCNDAMRKAVARLMEISHNDLDVAREFLEGCAPH